MAKRVSLKGKGADLFFGDYMPGDVRQIPASSVANEPDAPPDAQAVNDQEVASESTPSPSRPTRRQSVNADAEHQEMDQASTLASTTSRLELAEEIEAIRKVVKDPGREVSFVRLTGEEKSALTDVIYHYKRRGVKTTENEINRIAINMLLADYRASGEQSMLSRVLAALRS